MKLTYLRTIVFCLPILFECCWDARDKRDYFGTAEVCDKLYVEIFSVYKGGVYGGDVHSDYLTDSLNFRIFVGTHDDSRHFSYECVGRKVIVRTTITSISDSNRVVNTRILDIDDLKRSKKFE